MAVVTTNLGVITAYGDAVAAGYRGTKAEWQALMANYATVGQQAAQDAQTASQAAQTATTKAGEASASADRAEEAADSITTPDATLTQAGVAADAKATGDEITELKSGFADLYNTAYVTDSANGGIAHFEDGADDVPMKSLKVNIVPVQSGSGDPSPDNVRPISGWDSVKVTRAGKNLLPMEIQSGSYSNGVTITVNPDLSITYNKPNGTNWTTNGLGTFMLQAGTYTLIEDADGAQNARISLKKLPDNTEIVNTRWDKRLNFTLTEATQIYADFSRASQATNLVIKFMIFKGDTATASDYAPYTGNTYDISLTSAGTVYGGTLDVVSGELRVTWKCFDGGDFTWTKVDGYNYGNFSANTSPLSTYYITIPSVKSSAYKSESNESSSVSADNYVWIRAINTSVRRIYVKDTSKASMTAEEFRMAMTGVQFVYELATPITIQLTPNQVNSLLGVNNIWADTGDSAVEYRADTKLYIEKLTQPEEDDMIADSAITEGQFFMVGNTLYRALTAIASGATITVGTNAQRVSLSDALNLVNT